MSMTRAKRAAAPQPAEMEVRVLDPRLLTDLALPAYATPGSAGLDLRAMITTPTLTIHPGEAHLIPTGIAIHIRDRALAGLILPRSGLGHRRGLIMGNGTGLIDSDYTGPLFVSCWNRSGTAYRLSPGERIAQLILVPVIQIAWRVVEEFTPTSRSGGGFGSTGTL